MLERTREGTRAGEGEGGQAGRYCCQLPARCFASAPGSEEAGPTQPQHPSPHSRGCKTLQKHWASNLASVLARRPRPPGKLGWGAAESPAPWCPPFVCVSTLNASLLGLLALSPGAFCTCWRWWCQAARQPGRAQARRERQMTGVIYIASTWLPFAVASDFSRVLPGRKQEALCSRQ